MLPQFWAKIVHSITGGKLVSYALLTHQYRSQILLEVYSGAWRRIPPFGGLW